MPAPAPARTWPRPTLLALALLLAAHALPPLLFLLSVLPATLDILGRDATSVLAIVAALVYLAGALLLRPPSFPLARRLLLLVPPLALVTLTILFLTLRLGYAKQYVLLFAVAAAATLCPTALSFPLAAIAGHLARPRLKLSIQVLGPLLSVAIGLVAYDAFTPGGTGPAFPPPLLAAQLLAALHLPALALLLRHTYRHARAIESAAGIPTICTRCGYDLSHTPLDAPCPECGLGVRLSVAPRVTLADCPPRFVARIARGATLLFLAHLVAAPVFLAAIGEYGPDSLFSGPGNVLWRSPDHLRLFLLIGLLPLAAALHFAAAVLLAADDRRPPALLPYLLRWPLRLTALALLLAAVTQTLCTIPTQATSIYPSPSGPVTYTYTIPLYAKLPGLPRNVDPGPLLALLLFAALPLPTLTLLQLRHLARRLHLPRLAEHLTILTAASLTLPLRALTMPLESVVTKVGPAFLLASVLPWTLLLLYGIWTYPVLFITARLFRRSARAARQTWHSADAAAAPDSAPPHDAHRPPPSRPSPADCRSGRPRFSA